MSAAGRVGLTGSGIALGVGAAAVAALAFVTGYRELAAVALAAVPVLALALVLPRATSPLSVRRIDVPRLVQRGTLVRLGLEITARGTVPTTTLVDQLAGVTVPIGLPQVRPDEPVVVRYGIRAVRRGAHVLGPVLEERPDPLALAVRGVGHDQAVELLVHPVVHQLVLSESGHRMRQARAVVPRFSEDPLADFRSLREYVPGDDRRLVHWPSAAKTGTLMVRDHFELRRTTRTVILETLDRAFGDVAFEDAVEIAASLVCESLDHQISVTARTRCPAAPGPVGPIADRAAALELFARVARTTSPKTIPATRLRLGGDAADQVFLVTGPSSPLALQLSRIPTLGRRLVVVRVAASGSAAGRLAARCVDVESAEQFAVKWSRGMVPV